MDLQIASLTASHIANDPNKNLPHYRCTITLISFFWGGGDSMKVFQQACSTYFPLTSSLKAEILSIVKKKLGMDIMKSHCTTQSIISFKGKCSILYKTIHD